MSNLREWAKKEVELACKKENPNRKEGEFDYGCACYESALKAFESLTEDRHSGFSIHMTKQILNRLIDGKVLTPIEDTEDIWSECLWSENRIKTYHCTRMSSLFKDVYNDGTVKYSDVDRFECVYLSNPNISWHNGAVCRIMHELYPITMPYMPETKPYTVYCEELLTDSKHGDFDTIGILYTITPSGDRVNIGRYLSFDGDKPIEISAEEYLERTKLHEKRLAELEE